MEDYPIEYICSDVEFYKEEIYGYNDRTRLSLSTNEFGLNLVNLANVYLKKKGYELRAGYFFIESFIYGSLSTWMTLKCHKIFKKMIKYNKTFYIAFDNCYQDILLRDKYCTKFKKGLYTCFSGLEAPYPSIIRSEPTYESINEPGKIERCCSKSQTLIENNYVCNLARSERNKQYIEDKSLLRFLDSYLDKDEITEIRKLIPFKDNIANYGIFIDKFYYINEHKIIKNSDMIETVINKIKSTIYCHGPVGVHYDYPYDKYGMIIGWSLEKSSSDLYWIVKMVGIKDPVKIRASSRNYIADSGIDVPRVKSGNGPFRIEFVVDNIEDRKKKREICYYFSYIGVQDDGYDKLEKNESITNLIDNTQECYIGKDINISTGEGLKIKKIKWDSKYVKLESTGTLLNWNTRRDGNGVSYSLGQLVDVSVNLENPDEVLALYSVWNFGPYIPVI